MNIRLNYQVNVVAFDNVTPMIKRDGSMNLVFSQNTIETGAIQEADVVAAVQFINENKWKEIRDFIDKAFTEAKKIEK